MRRFIRTVLCAAAATTFGIAAADLARAVETDADERLIGLAANYLSLAPFTPGQLMEIDSESG